MTALLREALGDSLRTARRDQQRTLREVAATARVSIGYLSEVERGQKEASSELLAAICGALAMEVGALVSAAAVQLTGQAAEAYTDGPGHTVAGPGVANTAASRPTTGPARPATRPAAGAPRVMTKLVIPHRPRPLDILSGMAS